MFETMTYNGILKRMLAKVPSQMDKREGSIIYDALAPAAMELMGVYLELNRVMDESFADTASRQYLVQRAAERGIVPMPATYAVVKGVFNIEVSMGARFGCSGLTYRVIAKIANGEYRRQCETVGTAGNGNFGALVPIEYIDGLTSAVLTELLIPAEDDEDTEVFRARYFASFESQAFGGNRADYMEKTNAIAGVGGCKVYPVWNGGGTVKLVILDSEWNRPSAELVAMVQNTVDPVVGGGTGLGFAPIGHAVTVQGASNVSMDVRAKFTFVEGYDFDTAVASIRGVMDGYFEELRQSWEGENALIVRVSQLETRILSLPEILDIEGTTINAQSKNIVLDTHEVPVLGVVTGGA